MKVRETGMDGLLLLELDCFRDERGYFFESFQREQYRQAGIVDDFVQDNLSRSAHGVLRGLHFQILHPQAQIVTVVSGRVFDVAVDLRPNSSTFKHCFSIELSAEIPHQLYMAPGFAHGFCVLSPHADLHYKVSRYFDPSDEGGVVWNDPDLAIVWPIDEPRLSARDAGYPRLSEIRREQLPHVSS